MNKPLVIYHADCADGFGAAFAAWTKFGDNAEYLAAKHGEETHPADWVDFVSGREVYILDFSFPRHVMNQLFLDARHVVWLDHHKTAFEMWCGRYEKGMSFSNTNGCYGDDNFDIILDDNKSGAMLAWEYFHPGTEVPMLIKHIDDYDRWQFKLDGTKEFNKALWSYAPWSFSNWKYFNALEGVARVNFICEGAAILRAHDQNVQSVVNGAVRACRIPIKTEQFGCTSEPGLSANCSRHLTSDVGHELATQSETFGLCWTLSQTTMVANCSLRSNGDYDVSAIAKSFGGGGHRNAAGFEVPIQTLLAWLK